MVSEGGEDEGEGEEAWIDKTRGFRGEVIHEFIHEFWGKVSPLLKFFFFEFVLLNILLNEFLNYLIEDTFS